MKDLALFPFFDNAQGSKDGKSTNKNQVSTVFFPLITTLNLIVILLQNTMHSFQPKINRLSASYPSSQIDQMTDYNCFHPSYIRLDTIGAVIGEINCKTEVLLRIVKWCFENALHWMGKLVPLFPVQ